MVVLGRLVAAVTAVELQYPGMRGEIIDALKSLSDRNLQERYWLYKDFPTTSYYEDLTTNINLLYDTQVLPEPEKSVGITLKSIEEARALRALGEALSSLIDELGDAPDSTYVGSDSWQQIVSLAADALTVLGVHQ